MFIEGPPTRGRLFVFVRFRLAAAAEAEAARMDSHPCHVTTVSKNPLFQLIWCSTYWIQLLIPRLHQFFRKFGKIFGSWRPSLIFFVKLEPCHPDNFKAAYPKYSIFNILHASINSKTASIFQKVRGNIRVMATIFNLFSSN